MKQPWVTNDSKPIYDNPWISVREDKTTSPRGTDSIYGVVHFKNYALGIVALDKNLNIYLVGQHRYPLDCYSWELPEGGGSLDIPTLDSAKRELKEETGIEVGKWELIYKFHTSNSVTDETGFLYLATKLKFGEPDFDETEDISIREVSLIHALEMIDKGEITDLITIAGILAVARKLNLK